MKKEILFTVFKLIYDKVIRHSKDTFKNWYTSITLYITKIIFFLFQFSKFKMQLHFK